jgi:uncharacterized protein YndB with AHSA1/START domain
MGTTVEENVLVITRVFNAPRTMVWKAWTDTEMMKKWWGPKDFSAPYSVIYLRKGGKYLNCMKAPDGKEYWSTGIYKEVVEHEKLVLTDSFADEKGNVVPASFYGMGNDFPLEMLITITLEDIDGKTKMTLRHEGMPAGTMKDMTGTGWNESFDKLDLVFQKQ